MVFRELVDWGLADWVANEGRLTESSAEAFLFSHGPTRCVYTRAELIGTEVALRAVRIGPVHFSCIFFKLGPFLTTLTELSQINSCCMPYPLS